MFTCEKWSQSVVGTVDLGLEQTASTVHLLLAVHLTSSSNVYLVHCVRTGRPYATVTRQIRSIGLNRWNRVSTKIFFTEKLHGLGNLSYQFFLANVDSRSCSLYDVARPSVCLSSVVCNARAPYSGGCNFRQFFYGIWYLGHPLTST